MTKPVRRCKRAPQLLVAPLTAALSCLTGDVPCPAAGALTAHDGLWESAAETAHSLPARLAVEVS